MLTEATKTTGEQVGQSSCAKKQESSSLLLHVLQPKTYILGAIPGAQCQCWKATLTSLGQ